MTSSLAILEAYRRSKAQRSFHHRITSPFDERLGRRISRRLRVHEHSLIHVVFRRAKGALIHARAGRVEQCEELLTECRTILEATNLPLEAHTLASTFLSAAAAYLEYRRAEQAKVVSFLADCIRFDIELEHKFGYSVMHAHRIQVLHNLARMLYRTSDGLVSGVSLCCGVLRYLDGAEVRLPLSSEWCPRMVERIPPTVADGLYREISGETASALSARLAPIPDILLSALSEAASWSADSERGEGFRLWFAAKQGLAIGETERFCKAAIALFDNCSWYGTPIWFAMSLDVAESLLKTDDAEICFGVGEILHDLSGAESPLQVRQAARSLFTQYA